jgi:exodeoxyribonuclease I
VPYIVYDTETSGLNTAFDQTFQFAAILADDDLREIDSFALRCHRLPHVVPSPGAMLVTGVRPPDLENAPLSHYEMIVEVNRRLSEWSRRGATFLGYNSIRFDETLLRQALYQNLLPVYLTITKGNTRADVMRMVQESAVHYPGAITIPAIGSKLAYVAKANGVRLCNAHDALADARATLGLARLLHDREPDGWQWMLRLGTKNGVNAALRSEVMCLTDWYFGTPYSFVVTEVGRGASSEIAVFDLAHDPCRYLDLPPLSLAPHISGKVKVIRRVRSNSQPMLFPLELAPDDVRGGKQTLAVYLDRMRQVRKHPKFPGVVAHTLAGLRESEVPSEFVEQRIYEGFPSDADTALLMDFHEAAWESRARIAARLNDDRLRKLAVRLIYVERPGVLKADMVTRYDEWSVTRIMAGGDVPWQTIPKALHEAAKLRETADPEQLDRLSEIEGYLIGLSQGRIVRTA